MTEVAGLAGLGDYYFFDLDGCVYFSDRPAPGAAGLLRELREAGRCVAFLTNNSTHSGVEVAERLRGMGLAADGGEVLTAADLIGLHLLNRYGASTVKVIGSRSLQSAMGRCGHTVLDLHSADGADFVVLGRDVEFSYERIMAGLEALEKGARAIAANPDLWHPGPGGRRIPETGAFALLLEAVSGRKFEAFGKPDPAMFRLAMERVGADRPERCVMIGDNLHTDIAGGRAAGMRTVWLTNGLPRPEPFPAEAVPDLVFRDLAEMAARLGT